MVTFVVQLIHISSSKDKNLVYTKMSYYKVIKDIWELNYIKLKALVFGCKYVEKNNHFQVNELGFT